MSRGFCPTANGIGHFQYKIVQKQKTNLDNLCLIKLRINIEKTLLLLNNLMVDLQLEQNISFVPLNIHHLMTNRKSLN